MQSVLLPDEWCVSDNQTPPSLDEVLAAALCFWLALSV